MPTDVVDLEQVVLDELPPSTRGTRPAGDVPAPARAIRTYPHRPMLLTFGSILQPDGGLQVRTRVLAESLTELGFPPAVVSTREDQAVLPTPRWARSFAVPRHNSKSRFIIDLVRLTRRAASGSSVAFISDAKLLLVLTAAGVRLPVVWDTNECQSLHYSRLTPTPLNQAKRLAWLGLERWAGHHCTLAVAIGDSEAAHWKRIHPQFGTKLVTVDHAPFASPRTAAESRAQLERHVGRSVGGPILVFVGTLEAKHNGPAARWIIDVLAPSLPATTTIALCGTGTEKLRGGGMGARVECLGNVDDVDSVIASADVCLAPLASGAGVKTKVLHYLAHGCRVAGTPMAFEGIDGAPGLYQASLASLPALVASLTKTVESPESAHARAGAQRAWLEHHHGREQVAQQWKEVLQCLSRA